MVSLWKRGSDLLLINVNRWTVSVTPRADGDPLFKDGVIGMPARVPVV